jgi:hypothetical protein
MPDSILNSLSAGRKSSIIVDCSSSGTTITPVLEGYELRKAALLTSAGGNRLDELISQYLMNSSSSNKTQQHQQQHLKGNIENRVLINPLSAILGKNVNSLLSSSSSHSSSTSFSSFPFYSPYSPPSSYVKSIYGNYHKSFLDLHYYDMIKDIKQWMSFIPHYRILPDYRSTEGLASLGVFIPPHYELPDGTLLSSSYTLCTLAESMYFPEGKQQLSASSSSSSSSSFSSSLSSSSNSSPEMSGFSSSTSVTAIAGGDTTGPPGMMPTNAQTGKRVRELIELDRLEPLFVPSSSSSTTTATVSSPFSSMKIEDETLSDLIYLVLSRVDVDARKDLLSNIVLCGGSSLISGLSERLNKELSDILPSHLKVSRFPTLHLHFMTLLSFPLLFPNILFSSRVASSPLFRLALLVFR